MDHSASTVTAAFLDHLSRARRVLLTTHVRPDGDALGSVAALALALRAAGKHTEQLLLSQPPTKYQFVFEESGLDHHDGEASPLPELSAFDTLVVSDTGTWSQLPGMEERVTAFVAAGGTVLILDHHQTQEPWGKVRLVDTSVSSAAELVCRTLRAWGTVITAPIAEALYVGIVSDTGWFQFSNTTAATHRIVADLMEVGVNPDRMYQRLFQSEREPRLRLQTRALESLAISAGGRLAVMVIRKEDFLSTGAAVPDTENIINFPLAIGTVEMSLLMVDPPEGGPIRISCRSKGKVDVAKFAEQFGGGGHKRASGLKISSPLDEAVARVTRAAESLLS